MNITKAFILGAGLGTRLRPLTNFYPKPLMPVWDEPLVYHSLRHCQQAKITEFAINTHHLAEKWQAFFPENTFEGAKLNFFHEANLLETGGGIKNIASFIGEDPILVFNGDIITDIDLEGLMKAHLNSGNVATLAVKSTGPQRNIAVEGERVIDIRNALNKHKGDHQFTGIYCISPSILELIPENEKISIIPAFVELIQYDKIGVFNVDCASWHDIGSIESYKKVHQNAKLADRNCNWIHPKAQVAESAQLQNCILWEKAIIAADAQLKNCIVTGEKVIEGSHEDAIL